MRALEDLLQDFLWFGFVPNSSEANDELNRISGFVSDENVDYFGPNDLSRAHEVWLSSIGTGLEDAETASLGVSAGFDSRTILGGLQEILGSEKVQTYTFGHPGAEDYDKVQALVGGFLTQHKMMDSTNSQWDDEAATRLVRNRPPDVALGLSEFGLARRGSGSANQQTKNLVPKRFTGFMGDSISGKKLGDSMSATWSEAIHRFVRRNQVYKGPLELFSSRYNPIRALPSQPLVDPRTISLDDQLDWGFRQHQRIRYFAGQNAATPFTDHRWWKSFAKMKPRQRLHQKAYRRIISSLYPNLFPDLRVGRRLVRRLLSPNVGPKTQGHIDMGRLLTSNGDFGHFLRLNLEGLRSRDILSWLDWDQVFNSLSKPNPQAARQLYALASLEKNLQVKKSCF